jgi:hypothetical protein
VGVGVGVGEGEGGLADHRNDIHARLQTACAKILTAVPSAVVRGGCRTQRPISTINTNHHTDQPPSTSRFEETATLHRQIDVGVSSVSCVSSVVCVCVCLFFA